MRLNENGFQATFRTKRRYMFRSKGFTIAFIIMSMVIVGLTVFFITLVSGGAGVAIMSPVKPGNETASREEVPSTEEEHSKEVRPLQAMEEHEFPVLNENIKESGKLTVIEGGAASGVTFHKEPVFDEADTPGNLVKNSGTFEVVSKRFIYDEDMPYIMYYVSDGYYVTSNPRFVSYKADSVKVLPDAKKRKYYKSEDEQEILLRIFQEDGNHVSFSMYYVEGRVEIPVLENVIASYDAFGQAHFEYKCGADRAGGTLVFGINETNGEYTVRLKLEEAVAFGKNEITEINLK